MCEIHGGDANLKYCSECYKLLPKKDRCFYDDCEDCKDPIQEIKKSTFYIK